MIKRTLAALGASAVMGVALLVAGTGQAQAASLPVPRRDLGSVATPNCCVGEFCC